MLKKLVKYGNSNALVLDKALLELLNISEGSTVKIKTDGTSLIITPQNLAPQETVTKTITPQETLQEAVQQQTAKFYKNPEDAQTYLDELRKVYANYPEVMKKLETPQIQQQLEDIEQRFKGNHKDPEYIKALDAVRHQVAPELIELDQQVQKISQKYAAEPYQYTGGKMSSAMADFKKVHEKYRHVLEQVAKLLENPDYIHHNVLLAEKYETTKNSPEYIKEYIDLISTYIPEYAVYQNEIKAVGESLQ